MTFTTVPAQTVTSISDEFFQVEGDIRISKRGLARLIGVSHTSVNNTVKRFSLETVGMQKPLKTGRAANSSLETQTIKIEDAGTIIEYFAFDATEISLTVQKQVRSVYKCQRFTCGFAHVQILQLAPRTSCGNNLQKFKAKTAKLPRCDGYSRLHDHNEDLLAI